MGRAERLQHLALASSFGEERCPKIRPGVQLQVKCPGVGADAVTRSRDRGSGICPAQPPACCEAARRAEAAAKMLARKIDSHPFLSVFEMSAAPHWWLAALVASPHQVVGGEVSKPRRFAGGYGLGSFL